MGQKTSDKRKRKEDQRKIEKLQLEISAELIEVFNASETPLDINQIVERYPDNQRRKENDDKTLKLYVSMGLGYLIQEEKVVEMERTEDGRYPLKLL